jgi:hypothetical protein
MIKRFTWIPSLVDEGAMSLLEHQFAPQLTPSILKRGILKEFPVVGVASKLPV